MRHGVVSELAPQRAFGVVGHEEFAVDPPEVFGNWGGYFYNVATGITEIVTPSTGSRNEALESWKSSSSGSSSNNKKDKDDDSSSDDLYTDTVFRPNAYQDAVSSKTAAYLSEQDKQIEDIAAAVDIMQGLGLAIGEKMDSQNAQLNAIETKTTHVHSKTNA